MLFGFVNPILQMIGKKHRVFNFTCVESPTHFFLKMCRTFDCHFNEDAVDYSTISDCFMRETLGCLTFFSSINVLFDSDYVRQYKDYVRLILISTSDMY
jgi:hypothetical protein